MKNLQKVNMQHHPTTYNTQRNTFTRNVQVIYFSRCLFAVVLYFLTLNIVLQVESCVVPKGGTTFGDFGKRADIVLRAEAISIGAPNRPRLRRYNVTFRVTGLFTTKFEGFSVGNNLTVSEFGPQPKCRPASVGSQYILFLQKPEEGDKSGIYSLRYNAVPLSSRNFYFFGRLLAGRISGRNTMQSGCRKIYTPRNGKIQCQPSRELCRIKCEEGYKVRGTIYRTCDIKTGKWLPKKKIACISINKTLSWNAKTISNKNNAPAKPWTPRKQKSLVNLSEVEEEEEEEETEEENVEPIERPQKPGLNSPAKPPSKPPLRNSQINDEDKIAPTHSTNAEEEPTSTNIKIFSSTSSHPVEVTQKSNYGVDSSSNSNLQVGVTSNSIATTSTQHIFDENELNPAYKPLEGFEDVVGCPTYNGTVIINSVWQGGFDGLATFSHLNEAIMGGWLLRIYFNVPVFKLATYVVDVVAASLSRREYCVTPKPYIANLYHNQELTVNFGGKVPVGETNIITGTAQLLGICNTYRLREPVKKQLLPFDDPSGNFANAWIRNITEITFNGTAKDAYSLKHQITASTASTSTVIPVNTESIDKTPSNAFTLTPSLSLDPQNRCDLMAPNGIEASGGTTKPSWIPSTTSTAEEWDYNEILHKSILFYEAQRSGRLPEDNRVPWRGHADLKDGCLTNDDLSGGWYNAGGNVKTTFLIAFSTTMLSWGAVDYSTAYNAAGETENMLAQIRWATDYLIKCHTAQNELVIQVGNYISASTEWKRPEQSTGVVREVYKATEEDRSNDVVAEVAAALAAASIVFNATDRSYSLTCLEHASALFGFALSGVESTSNNGDAEDGLFTANNAADEISWAATWLYKATGKKRFLVMAEQYYQQLNQGNNLFYWGDKTRGVTVLLSTLSDKPGLYKRLAWSYMRWVQNTNHFMSFGLMWLDHWGPTMLAANAAFLALQTVESQEDHEIARSYYNLAKSQMNAIIGKSNQGYVVGIGPNAPKNPHHRASTCPNPPMPCLRSILYENKSNEHILYGALVNGPSQAGRYRDTASDDIHNKVSIDFNAGFQSLAAGLKQFLISDRLKLRTRSL